MPGYAWMRDALQMVYSTKDAPQSLLHPLVVVPLFRRYLVQTRLHLDLHDCAKAEGIPR